ncbi:MAG: trimethylamine--corrinoid protein Co-methyltransferase, partial [Candidatus Azotimanducaceae bacterium]
MSTSRTAHHSRGGRKARIKERQRPVTNRAPYIHRQLSTFNILNEEGLSLIEQQADKILEEIGMEFRDDPEILGIFKQHGCDVRGERVRFDAGFCRQTIQATAPAQFTQHARNSDNNVVLGGNNTVL